jgi:hypothetical protein
MQKRGMFYKNMNAVYENLLSSRQVSVFMEQSHEDTVRIG